MSSSPPQLFFSPPSSARIMESKSTSQAVEPTSSSRTRGIFNDNLGVTSFPSPSAHKTFLHFSRLLPELRLYIWKLCLPPRRMISIRISQPKTPRCTPGASVRGHGEDDDGASAPHSYYTALNSLGNIVSSYPYRVHVPRFEQWSRALEYVNRESRQAFLSFYRIPIPIYQEGKGQEALLRLNPDTDILEVQLEQITRAPALVAFFHDAVANDPVGRGIAHLALGRNINDINQLAELTSLAKSEGSSSGIGRNQDTPSSPNNPPLHPVAAASMKQWLQTGLRTFYSVISPSIGARNVLGIFSCPSDGDKYHQNRSIPISAQARNAQATEYSSVGPDPRPIEEVDLAHVAVGTDPRRHVYSWHRVLANLGVDDPPRSKSVMQIRYLLAIWPDKWNVAPDSREGFVRFLEEADGRFAKHMVDFKKPPWGDRIDEETWRRQHRTLNDVAGLWIFEADTFGEVPSLEESVDITAWRPKLVKDLTATRPELFVFHLF